jgi:hypothetical protein
MQSGRTQGVQPLTIRAVLIDILLYQLEWTVSMLRAILGPDADFYAGLQNAPPRADLWRYSNNP